MELKSAAKSNDMIVVQLGGQACREGAPPLAGYNSESNLCYRLPPLPCGTQCHGGRASEHGVGEPLSGRTQCVRRGSPPPCSLLDLCRAACPSLLEGGGGLHITKIEMGGAIPSYEEGRGLKRAPTVRRVGPVPVPKNGPAE